MIVSIEGLPGSGKTTTAKLLAEAFGIDYAHERSADVPFLDDFYRNIPRYTFETELCFVLVHYHQYRDLAKPTILDFSPVKDLVFADANLGEDEHELFRSIYDHTSGSCPLPDCTLFLNLDTDLLLDRIDKRGREYEKGFDPTYLEKLGDCYRARRDLLGKKVATIEVGPGEGRHDVVEKARVALHDLGFEPPLKKTL